MKTAGDNQTWSNLVAEFGAVGVDLTRLNAAEGSAGNISAYVQSLEGLDSTLQPSSELTLPVSAPALAGGWVIVTGTGCRLRDLEHDANANLCALQIHAGGQSARLYSTANLAPTSELNSHLVVHNDQVYRNELGFHALVHAQPRCLTYLSHHRDYQETAELNRHLLRWEPETMMIFPEGIATISFQVPGSEVMMLATVAALQSHKAVVWQRHGILTRSDESIRKAGDLVEYAEAAAYLECLNLLLGAPSQGMSADEIRKLREAWGLP